LTRLRPENSTSLIIPENNEVGSLGEVAQRASEFASQSKAKNTIRGYTSDWSQFCRWCSGNALSCLPATPETVALYVTDLAAQHKPATLNRHLAAISQTHQIAGFETPTRSSKVRLVMAGIRRTKGIAQTGKTPVVIADLRRMVDRLPATLISIRDRAILLVGFAGAFRRSELVTLDHRDVEFTREGLIVTIRRSKTDQEGAGGKIGIPYGSNPATCPVRSLQDWIERSSTKEGPLFRPINRHSQIASRRLSGEAVAEIVKRHAEAVGLNASDIGAHSLRSGLATSSAAAGASERAIMNQTRHRSLTQVRRYIRDGNLFRENAAAVVGL
jgi:site-specific recombinase XerD